MLVLSRKKNESIHIAGNIKITILDISGDNIKIGIEAPRSIEVHRSEVIQAIREENRQASSAHAALIDLATLFNISKN